MRGGLVAGDRFVLRQATMEDLIAIAYKVDALEIFGGPGWLGMDRFDVIAKAPRSTSEDDLRLMLRALLADRFKLTVHSDIKPMPAFVLSAGKSSRLKPADGSGEPGCQYQPPPRQAGAPATITDVKFSCHNVTMESFAEFLHAVGSPYLARPVVDATGLKGAWDFDLHWTYQPAKDGSEGLTLFEAVEKQLGLKLGAKNAPLPVVAVNSVNEKPTANAPGVDKALPALPPAEFEVAVIKPSDPKEKHFGIAVNGGAINIQHGSLQTLIAYAWDIDKEMIADPPKWLNQDFYDVMGKAAARAEEGVPGSRPDFDIDDLREMMRSLLADRFKLVTHTEDRPFDSYTLLASNAKLKKADPANRASCKTVWGDEKDPTIEVLTCQNITMAEFSDELRSPASGYIKTQVLDATGLDGAYDFVLRFNSLRDVQNKGVAPPPSADDSLASEPSGAISLFDALSKQLGLKLEKQKRPTPMLVIDHVEEKPTEN
jgi:uncharacterized protein (TIGR03435 family)